MFGFQLRSSGLKASVILLEYGLYAFLSAHGSLSAMK